MSSTFSFVLHLITQLSYVGIFVGALIEGPLVGFAVGFFIKLGFLNLYLAYIVYVIADVTADLWYYFIGYGGEKILFKKFNISDKNIAKVEKVKELLHTHPEKIIILGKLTHFFGVPILLGMGMAHYNIYRFLLLDFLATLVKSAILIAVGYYFSEFWTKPHSIVSYIGWVSIFSVTVVIIYFIVKKTSKDLWDI